MNEAREFRQSPVTQGMSEQIAYALTTTPWGSSPTSPAVKIYLLPDYMDVSATNLSGSASANGDVITTPKVINLAPGREYRMEIQFTASGSTWVAWGIIRGER